ncbi:hypothetical protein WMY93_003993 [Mugilogobius chulae]|uniref:Uncharacterized protein n=1 Tax=Mugilogobius chulae TaxID=88201 RepID=A0AAW0PMI4_9GOBI
MPHVQLLQNLLRPAWVPTLAPLALQILCGHVIPPIYIQAARDSSYSDYTVKKDGNTSWKHALHPGPLNISGTRSKDIRSPPTSLVSLTDFPLMHSSSLPAPIALTESSAAVPPRTPCLTARCGLGGCVMSPIARRVRLPDRKWLFRDWWFYSTTERPSSRPCRCSCISAQARPLCADTLYLMCEVGSRASFTTERSFEVEEV